MVPASVPTTAARNAIPLICSGHIDCHIDQRELPRRVGPKRAEDFGLCASVNPVPDETSSAPPADVSTTFRLSTGPGAIAA
jgi:hypothetical protein